METEMTPGATEVADALKGLLCNAIVFYFTAHRAHWNVTGPDFAEYHKLFGDIYDDVYDAVDPLAENIRKLGHFPPTLSYMVESAMFKDETMTTDAKELALDIYKKNVSMVAALKAAFDVANAANEQGVANFIAERIDMHQKWQWQLSASLQASGAEIPAEASSEEEEEGEMEEEMSGPMDSAKETEEEAIVIADSVEPKELGKKLDVSEIEDAVDTTPQYWTSTEKRVASKYKELRNHDINRAENYLVEQVRSGFVSRKFNPFDVKN